MTTPAKQAPRSLWDPNYVDETWINDKVMLIPRLRSWVNSFYYTGTPVGMWQHRSEQLMGQLRAELDFTSVETVIQTFAIMGRSINQFELKDADVVLRPRLTGVGSADFTARARAIAAGREAAQAALPELRAKLAAAMH